MRVPRRLGVYAMFRQLKGMANPSCCLWPAIHRNDSVERACEVFCRLLNKLLLRLVYLPCGIGLEHGVGQLLVSCVGARAVIENGYHGLWTLFAASLTCANEHGRGR